MPVPPAGLKLRLCHTRRDGVVRGTTAPREWRVHLDLSIAPRRGESDSWMARVEGGIWRHYRRIVRVVVAVGGAEGRPMTPKDTQLDSCYVITDRQWPHLRSIPRTATWHRVWYESVAPCQRPGNAIDPSRASHGLIICLRKSHQKKL